MIVISSRIIGSPASAVSAYTMTLGSRNKVLGGLHTYHLHYVTPYYNKSRYPESINQTFAQPEYEPVFEWMAKMAKQRIEKGRVLSLDVFEGMPFDVEVSIRRLELKGGMVGEIMNRSTW